MGASTQWKSLQYRVQTTSQACKSEDWEIQNIEMSLNLLEMFESNVVPNEILFLGC